MKCVKCRGIIDDNPKKCPLCNINYTPSPLSFFECQNTTIQKYIGTSPIAIVDQSFDSLNDSSFENCRKLQTVILPSSIKSIGASAFSNCVSLKSFTTPKKVKSVKASTFSGCTALESLILTDKVEKIDDYAFSSCISIKELTIPASVQSISKLAFAKPQIGDGLAKVFGQVNKTMSCKVSIPKHLEGVKFVDAEDITFTVY